MFHRPSTTSGVEIDVGEQLGDGLNYRTCSPHDDGAALGLAETRLVTSFTDERTSTRGGEAAQFDQGPLSQSPIGLQTAVSLKFTERSIEKRAEDTIDATRVEAQLRETNLEFRNIISS
ncbi:MAG: hypothetical protein PXZ08_04825 [Actinomycetota bacterium]|nr:hypothetical protein [Actinomycetota bacterium]